MNTQNLKNTVLSVVNIFNFPLRRVGNIWEYQTKFSRNDFKIWAKQKFPKNEICLNWQKQSLLENNPSDLYWFEVFDENRNCLFSSKKEHSSK